MDLHSGKAAKNRRKRYKRSEAGVLQGLQGARNLLVRDVHTGEVPYTLPFSLFDKHSPLDQVMNMSRLQCPPISSL